MTKEDLKDIISKEVEKVWYGRRSLDPVKEQTELLTDAIWGRLKLHEFIEKFNGISRCDMGIGLPEYCEDGKWVEWEDVVKILNEISETTILTMNCPICTNEMNGILLTEI